MHSGWKFNSHYSLSYLVICTSRTLVAAVLVLLAAIHREYGSLAALATGAHQASRRGLFIAVALNLARVSSEVH